MIGWLKRLFRRPTRIRIDGPPPVVSPVAVEIVEARATAAAAAAEDDSKRRRETEEIEAAVREFERTVKRVDGALDKPAR